MPSSCWLVCVFYSKKKCPKQLVGFQKPHVRHSWDFFSPPVALRFSHWCFSHTQIPGEKTFLKYNISSGNLQWMISHLLYSLWQKLGSGRERARMVVGWTQAVWWGSVNSIVTTIPPKKYLKTQVITADWIRETQCELWNKLCPELEKI